MVSNPLCVRLPIAVVAFLLSGLIPVSASGSSPAATPASPTIDVDPPNCQQIPPEEVPPVALAVEPELPLEARVMVEKGDVSIARGHLKVTRESFAAIGIRVKVRVDQVVSPSEWGSGDQLGSGPDQAEILEFMKAHYGGQRPQGVDVVYFMTRHWAGGFADCIGGVRYPERAFAFGSIDYAIEGVVPAPTADEGVIAAHEIGHLLGAQHHYANCVEALPAGVPQGDANPCTTMWPVAAAASSTFGLVERSFIRAYAAEYAKG